MNIKSSATIVFGVFVFPALCFCQDRNQESPYPVDKASVRIEGVPLGKLIKRQFTNSKIFPGTQREFAVYVPAQYDGSKGACLMVFQDGMRFASDNGASKVPIVFDNLIHSGAMPITIGVFVDPGVVPAVNDNALPRFNRSLEYDSVDDRYVSFLIDELLPEVAEEFNVSADPNDRGICGSSSGGIAAFNVAWQRPDQFRRVYSMVGTYTGLRGANELPMLVRKTVPKPLRVFLQDGINDQNIYCGNWWIANQDMFSALKFSGYEVDHVWGEGFHGQEHGGAIFPDAMRFLWKDYPRPVSTHWENCQSRAPELLPEDGQWELVVLDHETGPQSIECSNESLYFADAKKGQVICRTSSGEDSVIWDINTWGANKRFSRPHEPPYISGLAIGPDGTIYAGLPFWKSVVRFQPGTSEFESLAQDVNPLDVVVAHDGTVYFTEPDSRSVWMVTRESKAKVAGIGFSDVTGIALSPDQTLVYVSDSNGRYVWSCVRAEDGTLTHIQPFFHIHSPPASVDVRPHSNGMCVDQDGWVWVATKMGIQVCDQPGRVNLIIPMPPGTEHPTNLCFGGADGRTIFATCGNKIFQLKTRQTGAMPWSDPVKPGQPSL